MLVHEVLPLCLCLSADIYPGTAYEDSDYTVEIAVIHVINRIFCGETNTDGEVMCADWRLHSKLVLLCQLPYQECGYKCLRISCLMPGRV